MKITNDIIIQHSRKVTFVLTCMASLALASCASDDDLGGSSNDGDKGAVVSFNVSDAQDAAQVSTRAVAGFSVTRAAFADQLGQINLTPEDLISQKIPAQGGDGNACLIENTTAGIDNMKKSAPNTRANITTMTTLGHFSSYGYKGTDPSAISPTPDWFYNSETNADGTLVNPVYWKWAENHFGKFYAIYPQVTGSDSKITVSPASHAGTPYVDFEVEPDVKKQKDLMTACSGVVEYAAQGVAPTTNLRFRHALTAVRFKVGSNLSWNKTITKVEIIGAMSKGKYVMATDENGTNAHWKELSDAKTFTLDGLNVSTSAEVNNILTGKEEDNYIFYMIPQELTGKGVKVNIYFSGSTSPDISATLKGEWKANTTKTYALSQNTSNWDYTNCLNITYNHSAVDYNKTDGGSYTVESFRKAPDGTQQPVKWKVVGYQESTDGGKNFGEETSTKPSWLTLSAYEGDGGTGTEADKGSVTLTTDIKDLLEARNKTMRKAQSKGKEGNPYDLSTKGGSVARSTANSYVISAPGHYSIPLVYGNAIKNGAANPSSYQTSATGTYVLQHFKDHAGQNITSPYINVQNTGNPATQASIVWADESGLVDGLSVTNAGANSYVNFHVPADKIKNGNAVIAVKNASGTIMWSWHLWFAPQDVLQTTACTNKTNHVYKFTNETLGFKYTAWSGTTYSAPRSVKVKVEQTVGQAGAKQVGYITITQNNGNVRQGYSTLYQFGRKDALPGTDTTPDGSFTQNGGNNMSIQNGIQNPGTFYVYGSSWYNNPPSGYSYNNLWSMENTTTGYNDNPVVKTIYDPSPAGFKMPASNAFTGFTTNGQNGGTMNVNGAWDSGWNFNNKITSPDATVYFPASGWRNDRDGSLGLVGSFGYFRSAVPLGSYRGCSLSFSQRSVYPQGYNNRCYGFSVRPVKDE